MENTWVLVANSSQATLYSVSEPKSSKKKVALEVVGEYQHAESREKDNSLVSDRNGEYHSGAYGHGNFIEKTDPKKHEAEIFARELTHVLDQARVTHQYESLILVAPPHFLGVMHQTIDGHPVKNLLVKEINKDYTKETPKELISLLHLDSQ